MLEALERLDPLWSEFFPRRAAAHRALFVERVDVSPDGVDLR